MTAAGQPDEVVVQLRWGGKDGKYRALVDVDGHTAASEHRTTTEALTWATQWIAGRRG